MSIKIENLNIIEAGAKIPGGTFFTRNHMLSIENINDFRNKYNNTDVYKTVYCYDNQNQNEANLFGPMYFDLDNSDLTDAAYGPIAFQQVKEDALKIIAILEAIFYVPQDQLNIFFSGGKGLHILVPPNILGIQPRKDLNNIYKKIATDIKKYLAYKTIDTQIYDNKRLFRLENSIHGKTGLFKIPLTVDELRSLSFEDIKLLAQQPRQRTSYRPIWKEPTYSTKANRMYRKFVDEWEEDLKKAEERRNQGTGEMIWTYVPPCIQTILLEGTKQGSRNNTIAVLSSHFRQSGLSEAECENRLLDFNLRMVTPSLSESEVLSTVRSIYNSPYGYGCRTLTDMGLCQDKCKIYQKRQKGE